MSRSLRLFDGESVFESNLFNAGCGGAGSLEQLRNVILFV
jgi:hypothetical protein